MDIIIIVKEIFNPNLAILNRNLKMYNMVNGTKYTLENLKITIIQDTIFFCGQIVENISEISYHIIDEYNHCISYISSLFTSCEWYSDQHKTINLTIGHKVIFYIKQNNFFINTQIIDELQEKFIFSYFDYHFIIKGIFDRYAVSYYNKMIKFCDDSYFEYPNAISLFSIFIN